MKRFIYILLIFLPTSYLVSDELTFEISDRKVTLNKSLFSSDLSDSEIINLYKVMSGVWVPTTTEKNDVLYSDSKMYSWGEGPKNPLEFAVIDLAHSKKFGFYSYALDAHRINDILKIGSSEFSINGGNEEDDPDSTIFIIETVNSKILLKSSNYLTFSDQTFYKVNGPSYSYFE